MILTRFITLDEYTEFSGDDLRIELGTEEKALAFLKRIEDRMDTFLDVNFNKSVMALSPYFTDYQKIHFKRALLEQAIYIFRNGDISVDSGYDMDKGVIASSSTIRKLTIAENAKQELILCGLWDRQIRHRAMRGLLW